MAKVLVGIACHRLEPEADALHTYNVLRPYGDVIAVFDRLPDWARRLPCRTYAVGPGVGVARDFILRMGVELGYQYIITADCHHPFVALQELGYGLPYIVDNMVRMVGWLHPWRDVDLWSGKPEAVVAVFEATTIPHTAMPLVVWETAKVRRLVDELKGYAIPAPGWGWELFIPTLAIATSQGAWLKVLRGWYSHKAKTGKEESWVRRWQEPEQVKMWMVNKCVYVRMFGFPVQATCPQGYEHLYAIADEFYQRHGWRARLVYQELQRQIDAGIVKADKRVYP